MGSYLYPLPLNKHTAGLPYFSSELNKSIKNNRTPNHEEMSLNVIKWNC